MYVENNLLETAAVFAKGSQCTVVPGEVEEVNMPRIEERLRDVADVID